MRGNASTGRQGVVQRFCEATPRAALAGRERVLGADHPDTLISRSNLASAYEDIGDLGRAIPLFEASLADQERVLGSGPRHKTG